MRWQNVDARLVIAKLELLVELAADAFSDSKLTFYHSKTTFVGVAFEDGAPPRGTESVVIHVPNRENDPSLLNSHPPSLISYNRHHLLFTSFQNTSAI